MIGISFLIGLTVWIMAAVMLSKRIPSWVGVTKHSTAVSVLLFPILLAAPIADDLIGRWQFYRLCEREAVVTLSPGWEGVTRAKRTWLARQEFENYLLPIHSQGLQFTDLDTGKVFMTTKSLFTKGGFLQRNLYGLEATASCQPKDDRAIEIKVKLSELLQKGEAK